MVLRKEWCNCDGGCFDGWREGRNVFRVGVPLKAALCEVADRAHSNESFFVSPTDLSVQMRHRFLRVKVKGKVTNTYALAPSSPPSRLSSPSFLTSPPVAPGPAPPVASPASSILVSLSSPLPPPEPPPPLLICLTSFTALGSFSSPCNNESTIPQSFRSLSLNTLRLSFPTGCSRLCNQNKWRASLLANFKTQIRP